MASLVRQDTEQSASVCRLIESTYIHLFKTIGQLGEIVFIASVFLCVEIKSNLKAEPPKGS